MKIYVNVVDENDNFLVFSKNIYWVDICEEFLINIIVLWVLVFDVDFLVFVKVEYKLVLGNM